MSDPSTAARLPYPPDGARAVPSTGMPLRRRAWVSLMAGGIAIALNTTLLAAADFIPLVIARGGLLKMLTVIFGPGLARLGVGSLWASLGLPVPGGTMFQLAFHVVVGLLMALLYGVALDPTLPSPPWR